ncbi:MAG: TonB-dependent receptor plug domain-containing protein [Ignavibacteriaceae bacterium]|nr:TonB-dependent receptor plug domain-containing protein [Ignavibacteriaceae bacterium]
MKKFFIILCAVLFGLAPALIQAQVSLNGTVVDEQSRDAVAGVTVLSNDNSVNTTTNEYGKFTISSNKEISSLTFIRIGYLKKVVQIIDPSKPVFVQLTQAPLQMTGVEVIGNNQLQKAQSIGTLTKEDLSRASGLSLENSINNIPGVQMQSRTPWGGARISIRGYYPNFSQNSNGFGYQLFINNIPVTDATGSTIMDDIDYSNLGSVEVIKGPASGLYGGFIAGTVNLTTAKPNPNETSFDQQTLGGSYGLFRTNTGFRTANENSDMVVNYGHQTYNSFRPNSRSIKDYVQFTGDFKADDRQSISTYFAYANSYEQLSGEIDSIDFYNRLAIDNPVYALNNSQIKIQSFRTGVTDYYKIDEHFTNQTTLFATGNSFSQPFAHGFTDMNKINFGGRTAFGFQTQGDNIGLNGTLGLFTQQTNYTSNGYFIPFKSPSDQENYALNYYVFTEWNIFLPMQFVVTVGGSLNKNEFGIKNLLKNNAIQDSSTLIVKAFDPYFTPSISILKLITENISVYGSISMGYTPPALSSIINSDNSINLSLKPESAVQYEIGTKGNFLKSKFSYQLALFDLENTDKLVSEKIGAVSLTTNAGKQQNLGAELSLSCLAISDENSTVSLLRPWLSYTYSDFTYKNFKSDNNNNAATIDFSGKDVARVPRNMFNMGIDMATDIGLYAFGSFQFVDKVPVTFDNSNYMKSYDLLSAKIGYQKKFGNHFSFDVAVGGDNLLSSTYYSYIFVGPTIGGLEQPKDGGTGDGYILPGSYKPTFYGNLTISYAL